MTAPPQHHASRGDVLAVYGTGLLGGVLFGVLPALSVELTDPDTFGLTPTFYGLLFVPQGIAAISGALLASLQIRRIGPGRLLRTAMLTALGSLVVLASAQLVELHSVAAYLVLLAAAALLGLSFGILLPLLMTVAGGLFPERRDRALLYLNALFALGPAIAPLIASVAVALGAWWLMPLSLLVVFALDLAYLGRQAATHVAAPEATPTKPPEVSATATRASAAGWQHALASLPRRFWVYAAFIFLYGVVQTLNSNWSALFMTEDIGASDTQGALALTVFWVMVAVGRLLFGSIDRLLPPVVSFRVLSFLGAAALLIVASVPAGDPVLALAAFGLVGLMMSVALPLNSSFAQAELADYRQVVSNALFVFLMVGYMITSFAVGPAVEHLGVDPGVMYVMAAVAAMLMGAISFPIVRGYRAVTGNGTAPA